VLVTIALIALLTGVLVVGVSRLLGDRPKSPDDLFWAAVEASRHDALLNHRDLRLSFDPKTHQFVANAPTEEMRYPFLPKETAEVDFLGPQAPGGSSSVLIGGQLEETQTIPAVMFYHDGTCSAFRVQFKSRNGVRVFAIDPWTCAPMLSAEAVR
jgi:hypothetical protein